MPKMIDSLPPQHIGPVEVRRDADGTIDEVCGRGVDVHLERMDVNKTAVLILTGLDGTRVKVELYADCRYDERASLDITVEEL